MPALYTIRRATGSDAQRVCDIYNWYVLHTAITFETEAVHFDEMQRRIREKLDTHDWLVADIAGGIVGYAYYGAFRPRAAYSHTVESTIYIAAEFTGKGIGAHLYSQLIRSAFEKGFREMIGVIALPNQASIKLHTKLGFRESGRLRDVGQKFGKYIDIALWQLRVASEAPSVDQTKVTLN
ncbi:MAG TPA: GNAT family N-acetyltransferase [Terracidiphilus sp.]